MQDHFLFRVFCLESRGAWADAALKEIMSTMRGRFHPVSRWRWPTGACAALAFAFLAAVPACAELGGNYYSVLNDQAELHATLTTVEHSAYTTYLLDLPDGVQVREYFSAHTGVFAVDWSGQGHRPDMRQLLGSYFERFQRPAAALRHGRNSDLHRVEQDFVLHSHVAMRHFSGRAYVPQFVPREVNLAGLR